ncbi:MAG: fluoride efflux transporter CrcB [Acidimicrobiales bacterium]
MITIWIGLVVAGAIGAPCRYLLDGLVQDATGSHLPFGTFLINVSGSFLLGVITGAALYHAFPATPKVILGTGFCGAYTTFSTWTFETVRLWQEEAPGPSVINAGLSLLAGLAAAGVGLAVAAAL